ncbi:MAG: Hsp33 family molecular chaperone HslO [Rhodospirillaceae bacterium]
MPLDDSPPPSFLDDKVHPFHVDKLGLNGRVVRLGGLLTDVVGNNNYPAPVGRLLSETVALAAVLASTLKYDGIFTLQIQGDGPISIMMADVTTEGGVRAYARFDVDRLNTVDPDAAEVPAYLGNGYLAFTVDQGLDTDRYQGIVELAGATLSDCAHAYFRQSEQLETAILLAAQDDPRHAGAIMIQRLPAPSKAVDDDPKEAWCRGVILMSSLTTDELLSPALTVNQILYRLYNQDGVRVTDPRPLTAKCRCSRGKVERTLASFPKSEISELAVDGVVNVTCEFCGRDYVFDTGEIDALFD